MIPVPQPTMVIRPIGVIMNVKNAEIVNSNRNMRKSMATTKFITVSGYWSIRGRTSKIAPVRSGNAYEQSVLQRWKQSLGL